MRIITGLISSMLLCTLAWAERAGPPVPELAEPSPTVFRRPEVVGWPAGVTPTAPPGFRVTLFAEGLDSGRWLHVLANGDVLVAQARTETMTGFPPEVIEALTEQGLLGKSADNILLFRQTETGWKRHMLLTGLNQPFGMAELDGHLYVASTDAVWRYPWNTGSLAVDGPGEQLFTIPVGSSGLNYWNNHWTRNLEVGPDGQYLYLTVGAGTNNDAEGVEPPERAAVWQFRPDGSDVRLYATGIRNPVGLAFDPDSGRLWTTVNERDGLGPDVPPDYLTEVVDGGFYGWPWVYFGTYPDPWHLDNNPDEVERAQQTARVPDLALGAHTVPLGLLFPDTTNLPDRYHHGAFVARRGGVGRADLSGFDVVFLPFADGAPTGEVETFLGGFIADANAGTVHGRPVGLAQLPDGSLLVTDDAANRIWQISPPASE